jgi:Sulfotransferase family
MGYGRSGSTLLDRLLGTHPNIASCGELCNLVRAFRSREEYCSCGSVVGDCVFWNAAIRRWRETISGHDLGEYEDLRTNFESRYSLANPLDGPHAASSNYLRYLDYTRALFDAIAQESCASIIVDSSKSPARAASLSRICELDIVLLHLVRDPRGVASSLARSYAKAPREGLQQAIRGRSVARTGIAWMVTNLFASRLRRVRRGQSILVRYEDYVAQPTRVFQHIGTLLGSELQEVVQRALSAASAEPEQHMVAGNRMRMKPAARLMPEARSIGNLRFLQYLVVTLLTLPLMLRFGYPVKGLPLRDAQGSGP